MFCGFPYSESVSAHGAWCELEDVLDEEALLHHEGLAGSAAGRDDRVGCYERD